MTSVLNNVPLPLGDPIANSDGANKGKITTPWVDYLTQLQSVVEQAPARIKVVTLTGQNASVAATDMTDGNLSTGLYRWDYYVAITTAAAATSSLTVSLDFKDSGQTKTYTGAAITTNRDTDYQNYGGLFQFDGSPVRYTLTYASNPASAMVYKIYLVLTEIQA